MHKKGCKLLLRIFDENIVYKLHEKVDDAKNRKKLCNRSFTLISNNCWGSKVYKDLNIKYNTPFIGLFLYAPCYIKLLKNLNNYLNSELTFVNKSKYELSNQYREKKWYPIGVLGDDVEVHFLHYKSENEAKEKWTRRKQRMNMENLFIEFSDRDLCTKELMKEFDNLAFEHKVCFTAKKYPEINCAVQLKEYEKEEYIGNIYEDSYIVKKHFDVVNWINRNNIN